MHTNACILYIIQRSNIRLDNLPVLDNILYISFVVSMPTLKIDTLFGRDLKKFPITDCTSLLFFNLLIYLYSFKYSSKWTRHNATPLAACALVCVAVRDRGSSRRRQEEPLRAAQLAPAVYAAPRAAAEESRTSAVYGSYSGVSFASSFDPDNVAVDRQPIYSGSVTPALVRQKISIGDKFETNLRQI